MNINLATVVSQKTTHVNILSTTSDCSFCSFKIIYMVPREC